jgi:hypothetical protein
MRPIEPEEALNLIETANSTLHSRLLSLQVPAKRKGAKAKNLKFLHAAYPFNSCVFRNGLPLTPQEERLPDEFLGKNGLPLGLIISNRLEVIDRLVWQGKVFETPSAILSPGNLIGLFEFIDYATKATTIRPDLTIVAGARTLAFAEIPRPGSKKGKLFDLKERHQLHHDIDDYDEESQKDLTEWQLISALRALRQPMVNWKAIVLYFSSDWIDLLASDIMRAQRSDPTVSNADLLLAEGWQKLTRIRDPSNSVYQALKGWGKSHSIRVLEAAHYLLEAGREVVEGRRPCYVPTAYCGTLGPYADFQRQILDPSGCHPSILEPRYLEPGESGYLPLARIFPDLFRKSALSQIREIFSVIAAARAGAEQKDFFTRGLDYDDLLSRLVFRLSSGKEKGAGAGGSIKVFSAKPDKVGARYTFQYPASTLADFYSPHFAPARQNNGEDGTQANLPPANSPFFRVAVRINR